MPRPWSIRLLRACLALWFVLSGGELGLVHACPMHDGNHASIATAAAHHGAHAAHTAGHAHLAPSSGTSAPHSPAHLCTCPGACSAASAVMLAEAPAAAVADVVGIAAAPIARTRTVRVSWAPHRLPFPNGPPASALIA